MKHSSSPIESVIQKYIEGYLNAESKLVAAAFHPETRLYSTEKGQLEKTEMHEWLANLDARKEKQDIRNAVSEILDLDISGNAATVKLALTFAKFKFIDYLSLLQIGDEWKIIGKIYQVEHTPL